MEIESMLSRLLTQFRLGPAAIMPALVVISTLAIPSASAVPDLKIETVQRFSGNGTVRVAPKIEEDTVYVQGNRRRSESRREQRGPLWEHGPIVTFYEPHTALIRRCDDDKTLELNLDDRTYQSLSLGARLTDEQIKALTAQMPKSETPTRLSVLHEITTTDTGERKQAFGYTARHVMTVFKNIPQEGANAQPGENVTDGWYIDLDTRISCDPRHPEPPEGSTYGVFSLVVGSSTTGQTNASKSEMVETKYIGKPETGFAISARTTSRMTIALPSGAREQNTVLREVQVTGLSAVSLDPALFEVPTNFRNVAQVRLMPTVSFWARWLAWAHYYWERSTRGDRRRA